MPYGPEPTPPTATTAFDAGWLDVGHGHRIHYEQAGAAGGIPLVLLHGGPGSGSNARMREIADPARYRIVQFDQRGAGRSTPAGETAHNHTDALVADIEALRETLRIERWLVCGGSWGASLALAYAARHRERASGVFLRGTFLTGRDDLDWFFGGAGAFAPEAHAAFLRVVPRRWHRNLVDWLDRTFGRGSPRCAEIAAAWQAYEMALSGDMPSTSRPNTTVPADEAAAARLVAKYRVQSHYLARKCFLGDAALLRAANVLRGLPVAIVHGERDLVCRPANAWRVHRTCAGSRLAWAVGAGHSPWHPATLALSRSALDAFAERGDFPAWPIA
jgi:proline iminopeptidase